MADTMFLVGGCTDGDPTKRVQVFVPFPVAYRSFDEAVKAAELDYRHNIAPGADVAFTVYRSASGCGYVEVTDGEGPCRVVGLYKIVPGEADSPRRP
jgi:hypothetical protein